MSKILKEDFKYFLLAGEKVDMIPSTGESPSFLVSEETYLLLQEYDISIYTKVERENGNVFCLGDYDIKKDTDGIKIVLQRLKNRRDGIDSSHKIYFGTNNQDNMLQFKLSLI